MRRFRFHPRALQEFEEAVDHYLELSPEAASRFVDAFEAAVGFARRNPDAAARIEDDVRRWNLRKFPYALIYRLSSEHIVIIAVMHARREPGYWKSRISS
ncbi:type II toxin-antitoxin system RelE/ParE family toxin [Sorangium sp. So ce590]|uniref:type II toxin-antitoxin system RelE/ParE family toxin n=1 Tax=unclassified Sorangium TaxID=2621164 RepID=UPI003F636BAD